MQIYTTLGALLKDYRKFNNLSQSDFAHNVNVDLRSVQRWEKGLTLLKSDKEEDVVLETLLPYQLIRNLNTTVPIPTFYDFKIRKYSLHERTNDLPKAGGFKEQIDISTNQLRKIDFDLDKKYIKRFIHSQKKDDTYLNEDLIKESIRLLPELNLILTSDSGYYLGHCIILPLKENAYKKLRNRELTNKDLRASDLVNYKLMERPVFYNYDTTADCNDTIFYIITAFLRFFRDVENRDYLFCSYSERDDGFKFSQQISGMKIVWEDKELQKKLGTEFPPRFIEGSYNDFLADLE